MSSLRGRGRGRGRGSSSSGSRGSSGDASSSRNLTPAEREARRKEQFTKLGGRKSVSSRLAENQEQIRKEYQKFIMNVRLDRILKKEREENRRFRDEIRKKKREENERLLDERRRRDATTAYESVEKEIEIMAELVKKREEYEHAHGLIVPKMTKKKYKELLKNEEIYRYSNNPDKYSASSALLKSWSEKRCDFINK